MQLLAGIARKVSVPVVVLSILGWMLFVIAFGIYNHSDAFETRQNNTYEQATSIDGILDDHRSDIIYFPYWCFIVAGPILFINLFVHLILGCWYSGLFTNFMVGVYLVVGGGVLYLDGIRLFPENTFDDDDIQDKNVNLYLLIEWVGCLASVFFLTLHMSMWPLFSKPKKYDDAA